VRFVHELADALHDLRADAFQRHGKRRLALALALGVILANRLLLRGKRAPVRRQQMRQRAEMPGEDFRHLLADAGDT
jgi:hypothetical protein